LALLLVPLGPPSALPQSLADRPDIWDLELGTDITRIPRLSYQDYACGTDGGPPAKQLRSFAEFRECEPEENGLREVQFRYDDELEYIARAYEAQAWIERLEGTKPFGAPSVVSALIDDNGVLQGIRIVTDDRVPDAQRAAAYTYRYQYMNRFGLDGWQCSDSAPDVDRRPVGDAFMDQRCVKQVDDLNLTVEAQYYRRPGQFTIDPVTQRITEGEFVSSARLEIYRAPWWPPDE
jgi:hypothetical protein